MKKPWIEIEKIQLALQIEPLILLLLTIAGSWIVYKTLLKDLSADRHRNLQRLFRNLLMHGTFAGLLLGLFVVGERVLTPSEGWFRLVPNVGFMALVWCAIVFVKTCRILAFEYLFFFSMRAGVPVLIVNLFSLLLSIVLGGWILASIFNFHLAPLLATSAIFSIVLGLALQDTLGNLIAGVALQLDKPYNIGDWIEVQNGPQKWIGQVREITWRAATLIAVTEETIIIPNRIMAQAMVANFSTRERPFLRGHLYRFPYGAPLEKIKATLLRAVQDMPGMLQSPPPIVLLNENTDTGMLVKLIFAPADYGTQFALADRVNSRVLEELAKEGLALAPPLLKVIQ